MEPKPNIQINIMDEKDILADEVTMLHNPTRFFIDVKSVTPRMDLGNTRVVKRHNVIILDPFIAKELLRVLEENIKSYEKKYGTIEKPQQYQKAEEMIKKEGKTDKKPQTYFG